MKLIRKIVRETLLIPTRIIQGAAEAVHDTVKIASGEEPKRDD